MCLFPVSSRGRFHDSLFQKQLHQRQDAIVGKLVPDTGHEKIMGDRIEVGLQVRIHDIGVTLLKKQIHPSQRVLAATARPKPVTVVREVLLKDRFQNIAQRSLNYPVSDRGDTQWPFSRSCPVWESRPF